MKVVSLKYTFNTRDLGGLKGKDGRLIKSNKLFRSGSLHKLSEEDIQTLINENIKVVVDFRSEKEFIHKADVRIDGITYINLPALPKDDRDGKGKHADSNLLWLVNKESGGKKLLMNTYKNMLLTEEGKAAFKGFFKVLMENNDGAILWHCSQGKDRAGMAAYLLEYALGVSEEDRVNDYMLTNIAMEKKIKQLTPIVLKESNGDYSLLPSLKDVFSADIDYLNEALNSINETYGSIDNLLLNELEVDIKLLQDKYLESK